MAYVVPGDWAPREYSELLVPLACRDDPRWTRTPGGLLVMTEQPAEMLVEFVAWEQIVAMRG